jgi:hypothetical protein
MVAALEGHAQSPRMGPLARRRDVSACLTIPPGSNELAHSNAIESNLMGP